MTEEHKYVKIARKAIKEHIKEGKIYSLQGELEPDLRKEAGVFVSLKKQGRLRGCIGTIKPTQENLADEIINNAVSAATRDPRFTPVQDEEIDKLVIKVDVLGEPERINNSQQLDVKKYGVIVKKGRRSGLLLPDLEGIDTVKDQIDIASKKAGINANEDVELYRFKVERYE